MTKHIPDFGQYETELSHITQKRGHWCIPANIEAVTKYFEPSTSVTQDYLWRKWEEACHSVEEAANISFTGIKNKVLDTDQNYSQLASTVIYGDIATLVHSIIRSEIDKGPVIISLPAEDIRRMHMYTVVGCNDLGGLHLHDTGQGSLLWKDLEEMKSSLEERSRVLSRLENRTVTDVLIIRPK
jgi:hypothetical protein